MHLMISKNRFMDIQKSIFGYPKLNYGYPKIIKDIHNSFLNPKMNYGYPKMNFGYP